MKFTVNRMPAREESIYKTLYIKQSLSDQISEIAKINNSSWNNVVISMIEYCLDDDGE